MLIQHVRVNENRRNLEAYALKLSQEFLTSVSQSANTNIDIDIECLWGLGVQ